MTCTSQDRCLSMNTLSLAQTRLLPSSRSAGLVSGIRMASILLLDKMMCLSLRAFLRSILPKTANARNIAINQKSLLFGPKYVILSMLLENDLVFTRIRGFFVLTNANNSGLSPYYGCTLLFLFIVESVHKSDSS